MKQSSDNHKALLLLLLLCFGYPGFGEDAIPPLTFTSDTGLVFVYGESKELVYKSSSGTDLLSLLVYPIPPSLGAYIGIEGRWRDSILGRLRLETVLPLTSGIITNDDWIYGSSFSDEPDVQSDSVAFMTGWIRADFELGFPTTNGPFLFETLVGIRYRQISWEGWDAYQISVIPDYNVGAIPGYVIDYRQTWLIPWMGLTIGEQKPASIIAASIRFSPWMYVVGRDVHMAREEPTTFIDVMSGGLMISGGLKGKIRLTGGLWLTGTISFDYCSGPRGDTYIYTVGSSAVSHYTDTGGAAFSMVSAYVGISIDP